MRIYKHFQLLLFCVGIRYIQYIAFYDRNNYKTKKQPHNLQKTINGPRGWKTRVTAS